MKSYFKRTLQLCAALVGAVLWTSNATAVIETLKRWTYQPEDSGAPIELMLLGDAHITSGTEDKLEHLISQQKKCLLKPLEQPLKSAAFLYEGPKTLFEIPYDTLELQVNSPTNHLLGLCDKKVANNKSLTSYNIECRDVLSSLDTFFEELKLIAVDPETRSRKSLSAQALAERIIDPIVQKYETLATNSPRLGCEVLNGECHRLKRASILFKLTHSKEDQDDSSFFKWLNTFADQELKQKYPDTKKQWAIACWAIEFEVGSPLFALNAICAIEEAIQQGKTHLILFAGASHTMDVEALLTQTKNWTRTNTINHPTSEVHLELIKNEIPQIRTQNEAAQTMTDWIHNALTIKKSFFDCYFPQNTTAEEQAQLKVAQKTEKDQELINVLTAKQPNQSEDTSTPQASSSESQKDDAEKIKDDANNSTTYQQAIIDAINTFFQEARDASASDKPTASSSSTVPEDFLALAKAELAQQQQAVKKAGPAKGEKKDEKKKKKKGK